MENSLSTTGPAESAAMIDRPGAALSAPSTYLAPDDSFPGELAELGLTEILVLHSRVHRQLDHEYLTELAGPHPTTLDRAAELSRELDEREQYLT